MRRKRRKFQGKGRPKGSQLHKGSADVDSDAVVLYVRHFVARPRCLGLGTRRDCEATSTAYREQNRYRRAGHRIRDDSGCFWNSLPCPFHLLVYTLLSQGLVEEWCVADAPYN